MKHDGHTHTEYCPHGTVADVEELVQRAIALGFKRYSITEHAPLPPDGLADIGGEPEIWTSSTMPLNDVRHYFIHMERLKKKYAADIELLVGFEVDYLAGHRHWTTDFLNEYGPQMDDGILSVHFLDGVDGLRCIDYQPQDYAEGIIARYGSFQSAQLAYYRMIQDSLMADLGPYKPTRLGHISLCQKFQLAFPDEDTSLSADSLALIDTLLTQIKAKRYTLDVNAAGLFKPDCRDIYPPEPLIRQARQAGIPLIYGSDAHDLADVGRGYDIVSALLP